MGGRGIDVRRRRKQGCRTAPAALWSGVKAGVDGRQPDAGTVVASVSAGGALMGHQRAGGPAPTAPGGRSGVTALPGTAVSKAAATLASSHALFGLAHPLSRSPPTHVCA